MNEMCEYPCVFAWYISENVEKIKRKGERKFALCPFLTLSLSLCVGSILSLPYSFTLFAPVKCVFVILTLI